MKTNDYEIKGKRFSIPNEWESLTAKQFEYLLGLIGKFASGDMSPAMVRIRFVCYVMGWDINKVKDKTAMQNVALMGDNIDFIFNIMYDDPSVLDSMDADMRRKLMKQSPDKFPGNPIAKYIARKGEYRFVVNNCFCAQLIPFVCLSTGNKFRNKHVMFRGYKMDNNFGVLSCSLRALQYIDARNLLSQPDKFPLMASILYQSGTYDPAKAHADAVMFARLPEQTLQAIAFNFDSFNNYLFKCTEFSLLTAGDSKEESEISNGAVESLYSLCADGIGNADEVAQLNLIDYLTLSRKKTIDAVLSLASTEMKDIEIADKTGLPLNIINKIIK